MATYYGWGHFKTEILLDCIDMSELDDLNDVTRDRVAMIIGATEINFKENSPMWNLLHTFFPTGSNTWTNILAATRREYDVTP